MIQTLLRVFRHVDMCDDTNDDQQQTGESKPVSIHQIALEETENQEQGAQYDERNTN